LKPNCMAQYRGQNRKRERGGCYRRTYEMLDFKVVARPHQVYGQRA
jgi:hypothetical protein